jgi:hypothetical protein
MIKITKQLAASAFFVSMGFSLSGCEKEEPLAAEIIKPLNAISMQVNGQRWQPAQIGEDDCRQTFSVSRSALTGSGGVNKPFYTIWAYQDPKAVANYQSENVFRLQFMNVEKVGSYPITGSYKQDFSSFVVFTLNKPGAPSSRYINKTDRANFKVEVNAFYPIPTSFSTGIEGTFSGTLYNESNPQDSITIAKGAFTFKKVNWSTFNQCAEQGIKT